MKQDETYRLLVTKNGFTIYDFLIARRGPPCWSTKYRSAQDMLLNDNNAATHQRLENLVRLANRRASQVNDLTKLQADIHQLREDARDPSGSWEDLDEALNGIEAQIGDCIGRARGETK